jgi:4'-phosphopantetheinyl transferase
MHSDATLVGKAMPIRSGFGDIDLELHRLDDEVIGAFADLLTLQERARADRFRHIDDRRRYIVGRGVLRRMLGRRLDRAPGSLAFGSSPHGKPTLADAGEIAFNVSHSGDHVLVAVGRAAAIGVDVEQMRPGVDLVGVGARVFTPGELASIAGAPDDEKTSRFFRHWTFKEAVVKAVGLGLSLDLKRFEIAFPNDSPQLISHGAPELGTASGWRLEAVAVADGYSAALAVRPW